MDMTDFCNLYTIIFMILILMVLSVVPIILGTALIIFLLAGEFIFNLNWKSKY